MPMLNEGNYQARVARWGFFESSAKGTPGFELVVRVHSQEADHGSGEYVPLDQEVTRSVPMWLSPKALGITAANLRSLGYEDKELDRLDPEHPEAFDLEDREVVISVEHEDYKEKPREKVQLVRQSRKMDVAKLLKVAGAVKDGFAEEQAKAVADPMATIATPDPDPAPEPPKQPRKAKNK